MSGVPIRQVPLRAAEDAPGGGGRADPPAEAPLGPVDREALLALVPRLRSYARALARSAAEADDLVQEALVRILAAASVPAGEALRPFALVTLRNLHVSLVRRRGAERRAVDEAFADAPRSVEASGESAAEVPRLAAMLRQLSPVLREAVILVGAHGLSHAEAARICGCAEGTMKARVSRARAALARLAAPGSEGGRS